VARADERQPATPKALRGFIQIKPKLDFGALRPGRPAMDAIRQAADELKARPNVGASLRDRAGCDRRRAVRDAEQGDVA